MRNLKSFNGVVVGTGRYTFFYFLNFVNKVFAFVVAEFNWVFFKPQQRFVVVSRPTRCLTRVFALHICLGYHVLS